MRHQDNQHFSHEHILVALTIDPDEIVYCNACNNQILEQFHGCQKCHYWLHDNCLNFPRSLEHPSHPSHPLTLLSAPTYSSRSFSCEACASVGNSFSISCSKCEFDLHLECASLPNSVLLKNNKHPHELKLIFTVPLKDRNSVFACNVCKSKMHNQQWLYYCGDCDFGAHLDCAAPKRSFAKAAAARPGSSGGTAAAATGEGNWRVPDQVEQIRRASEAEEQIAAAHLEAKIKAQTNQAILDLWDPPGTRYRYV